MDYRIELKPRAEKDLAALDRTIGRRITEKLRLLQHDLGGDVKRLKDFDPKYRLRVGDYRVLFNVEGDRIIVYRFVHRSEAYDR